MLHEKKKKSHGTFSSTFGNSWKLSKRDFFPQSLDIQLWAGIRPLNSWVRRILTPCHFFKLFIPPSLSNKSTRDCHPPTACAHTHTYSLTHEYSCHIWLSENTRQRWGQASYHGSLAIIVSSTTANGNKCAHVLKGLLGKISGAAWGHNGRLCRRERIWSGRQQQSCWTQGLSAGAVWENHVRVHRTSSLGKGGHLA